MFRVDLVVGALLACLGAYAQDLSLTTDAFTWTLTPDGRTASLTQAGTGRELCANLREPAFQLVTDDGSFLPEAVSLEGDLLTVRFAQGSGECALRVTTGPRHIILKLASLTTKAPLIRITLCKLYLPREGTQAVLLNGLRTPEASVALMPLSPSTCPTLNAGAGGSASPGASAEATQVREAKVGTGAGRFAGSNPTDGVAWNCWYQTYDKPLDLRGHVGIGAWIYGDGKGELLKIQLTDGAGHPGHYRDYYVTIDFTGWKWCELPLPPNEPIDYSRITQCNIYFNGMPPHTDVECIVDDIRALRELTGEPSVNPRDWVFEDFEDPNCPYFDRPATIVSGDCLAQYGTDDAGVALIACPDAELPLAIEEMEMAAGLPSPHFGGQWSKISPDVKGSYLFIFGMDHTSVQTAIDFAKACNFSAVLIGEDVWAKTCGHFEVRTDNWPGGVADLKAAVDRFHAAGLRCGLHFLCAGVGSNDAYVTPKPDDRLVMDVFADLGADVDATAEVIPTLASPAGFPLVEGGYMGDSAIVRIGDELIAYQRASYEGPFGFTGCQRGYLGTTAAAHKAGDKIAHMKRSYGLFLHDQDKGLTDEVAANVARVANAVGADMMYHDGAESLQGPHWRYQAKLIKSYWDALGRNDVLMQASSLSQYSYHILSRCASADGHGDLKGYLDERISGFGWLQNNLMPLDLGWYYIHTLDTRPDQFEYICQKALGYGCSISVQTTPYMIKTHPRMDEFIRLFRDYEDLRKSGQVSEEMKANLRVPRQEYVLTMEEGKATFRRAAYAEAATISPGTGPGEIAVPVDPALGKPRLCVDIRAGQQVVPDPAYDDPGNWLLEDFEDLAPYGAQGEEGDLKVGTNLAGSTSPGITQALELVAEGAKLGARCAKYTATSTRTDGGGWSAVGREIEPPLDLREHVGLGVWICGDGSGAQLKIQPRDAAGHAQDYYTPINFTGWRYFILRRPATPYPEPIVYDDISYLTFYYNGIPAGKTCTVLVDGLKALRTVGEVKARGVELALGGEVVRFDAEMGLGDCLLYRGGATATHKRTGQDPVEVPVTGSLNAALSERSVIRVRPVAGQAQTRELWVQPFVVYD